ncbi:MAG: hypothetical protein ACREOQ_22115 [Gemmatimonadales bacterium]
MANERNVERLAEIIQQAMEAQLAAMDLGGPLYQDAQTMARLLAERGVLVPAALTDDEAVKLGADAVGNVPTDPAEIALCVREGLERMARGTSVR